MKRILIIEDDDELRATFREILQKQGYEILEADNGDDGIRIYRDDPTDLVISDILMPGKEGIQTMMELKNEYPDIKIIAMSGGGFRGQVSYLDAAELLGGAAKTFAKPVDPVELIEAIKELIGE